MLFEGYTGGGSKDIVDGLMSTGDVGRFDDDGRLYVEGRDDEMIVSGGENVFPKEVEDCLARHEAVVEAAAIGVDDDDYGKRLRAFVVRQRRRDVAEDDLKAWVKENLARYKVPREIVFLDELPRNATGKVLKRELGRRRRRPTPVDRTDGRRVRAGHRAVTTEPDSGARGTPAPDFELRDQFGQDVHAVVVPRQQGRGAGLLPLRLLGVCTGEMSGIRDRLDEFLTFDTEVLAVSCDPVFTLRAFADADGLNFPLLSDFWPHGEVARAYDVFDEARGCPRRSSYVVDKDGHGALVGAQRDARADATSTSTCALLQGAAVDQFGRLSRPFSPMSAIGLGSERRLYRSAC